jgi:hypothetical protein
MAIAMHARPFFGGHSRAPARERRANSAFHWLAQKLLKATRGTFINLRPKEHANETGDSHHQAFQA